MKLQKWSDTLAKSNLSPERRARIQAEVEQELLEMNLQELRKAAGITQADVAAKTGMA
jgi:DNA-binding XRE family transcriptional regulator